MIEEVVEWMNSPSTARLIAGMPHHVFFSLERHGGFYRRFGRPGRRGSAWTVLLTMHPIRGGEWATTPDPVVLSLGTVHYLTSASVVVGHILHTPRGLVRVDENHVSVLRPGASRQDSFQNVASVLDSGSMIAFTSGEDALLFAVKQQRYVELR